MFHALPSSLEYTQRLDVSAYVKVKKVQKPKGKQAQPKKTNQAEAKPKRRSPLDELRRAYVGKVIEMTGEEIKATHNMMYKFPLTDVNRRRLVGSTQLTHVVALSCEKIHSCPWLTYLWPHDESDWILLLMMSSA